MRRAIAGPRRARIRPIGAVRVAAMAGAVLLVAACGPADTNTVAATATEEAAQTTVAAPATTVASMTSAPATSAAPQPVVVVPDVVGMTVAQAKSALSGARLRWRLTVRRTTASAPGTVVAQSPAGDRSRNPDSVITLVVAQAPPAPKPTPTPKPEPTTEAPTTPACHPSYVGACLDPDASDYDCVDGSGNGPKYTGRVTVVGPDVFDLDRDGDGIGCERD
jgi:resuscitation-promoting factor RpfB